MGGINSQHFRVHVQYETLIVNPGGGGEDIQWIIESVHCESRIVNAASMNIGGSRGQLACAPQGVNEVNVTLF